MGADGSERVVTVVTDAGRALALATPGAVVVVADPDGRRAGEAAAAIEAAGGRAACFADPGDRAAVEAMAVECLGATRVEWA